MSEANSREASFDRLQKRLETFGASLTEQQCKEFRRILDDFAALYYEVGEMFKLACITLIPGKVADSNKSTTITAQTFKPAKKETGDPLKELLHNMSNMKQSDVSKLIEKLNK